MVAPFLPYPLKTADNPDGYVDPAAAEAMREVWATGFAGWLAQAAPPAFGPGASAEQVAQTIRQMLRCSLQAVIECNVTGSQADMRAELRRIATPTLVLHGDADGSCPLEFTGRKLPALMPNCELKVYPGATHTVIVEQAAQLVDDILTFIEAPAAAKVA
jgi:non-heme chloroperoxidase